MLDSKLTAHIENGITAATVPLEMYPNIEYTHAELLAFMREAGHDEKIIAFLERRGDCAGATPAQWMQLSAIGMMEAHKTLASEDRPVVSRAVIGNKAFDHYVADLLDQLNAGEL